MSQILWGFQRANDNYRDLQLQHDILQYIDDINIDMNTFSSEEVDYDTVDTIKKQIRNITIVKSLDGTQNKVLEYMLAVALIKASVCAEEFFIKLDQIERHFSTLKWRLHELVKIMAHSADKQKYKVYLEALQNLSEIAVQEYIENGVPIYNCLTADVDTHYQEAVKAWQNENDITFLWGNRGFNIFNLDYEGERTAFYTLYILNQSKYVELIQKFKDPFSSQMALYSIKSELDDIYQWQELVNKVENAFDNKGNWDNAKLLLPLLMEIADGELKSFESSFNLNIYSSQEEVDSVIAKINSIIEFIVSNLISKSSKGTLRWMLYKIKDSRNFEVMQEVKIRKGKLPDIHNYIYSKYIDSFCDQVGLNSKDLAITWKNELDYEHLCFNLFQMYSEYTKKTESNIKNKDFFTAWSFDAETWYGDKGNKFRKSLQYLYVFDDQIGFIDDKYRLLAFLLFKNIQNKDSLEDWYKLLLSTDLFLDILKYSKDEKFGFDNRTSARESLRLISRIGLDLLLILINQKDDKSILVHDTLFSFYFKCLERDFSPNFYFECIKLLALLRVYVKIDTDKDSMYTILNAAQFELKDYLNVLQPYNMMYAKLVHFLNTNGLDKKYFIEETHIKAQMQSQVDILETMLNLQDRHYEISSQILDVMRDILDCNFNFCDK